MEPYLEGRILKPQLRTFLQANRSLATLSEFKRQNRHCQVFKFEILFILFPNVPLGFVKVLLKVLPVASKISKGSVVITPLIPICYFICFRFSKLKKYLEFFSPCSCQRARDLTIIPSTFSSYNFSIRSCSTIKVV